MKRQLFFDTSALVKYMHVEVGSDRVIALIDNQDHAVWVSELARIEFVSAMHRKFREGVLTEDQLRQALYGFDEVLRAFRVEPVGQSVVDLAEQLIRKHGQTHALRTLDALHLATFVLVAEEDWRFVVADDRLFDVAQQEGCACIHPLQEGRT